MAAQVVHRILLLNQVASPLFTELAEAVANGCAVECVLVTGDAGSGRQRAEAAGVRIVSARRYSRASAAARLASWLAFALRAAVELGRRRRDSLAIVSTNPPVLPALVWLVSRLVGIRFVVVVYDLYPEVLVASGRLTADSLAARLWGWANRRAAAASEGVVTIGRLMAVRLAAAWRPEGTALGRVRVLPPWVDTEAIRPLDRATSLLAEQLGLRGRHVVLCAGNMGLSQDTDSLLAAAAALRRRLDVHFLVIGHGARWQQMADFQAAHGLPNLTVLPSQPPSALPAALALAQIAVVSIGAGYEGLLLPSRTCYHMAAGAALLGICSPDSDLCAAIEDAGCGTTVPPGQPDRVAAAIEWLLADPARLAACQANARHAAVSRYSRREVTQAYVEMLSELGCAARRTMPAASSRA